MPEHAASTTTQSDERNRHRVHDVLIRLVVLERKVKDSIPLDTINFFNLPEHTFYAFCEISLAEVLRNCLPNDPNPAAICGLNLFKAATEPDGTDDRAH